MESTFLPSACPHDCPSTCALEIERLDAHTIGKVRGAKDNDYTQGVICAKVAAYRERVHHPDRLSHPLKRIGAKGEGKFARISWDEALDETVDQLKKATAEFGAESVWPYYFAGTMGLVQRDGINRLRNVFGYSRQEMTICTLLPWTGWVAGTGAMWGTDPREIAHSDLIIVWGGNPVSTQVNVMTHIAKARKTRGAKLIVIDPYRTPTAEAADTYLAIQPGTDGALACAVMNVLFAEGYADEDYLARYTDKPDQLRQHLSAKTPEWASKITGIPVSDIYALARAYGQTKNAYIRIGYGFARSRNGSANLHAVSCLPAVTGAWQHKGGGALHSNSGIYNINQTLITASDLEDRSIREMDMSRIGAVLTGEEKDLFGGPPVKALFIQNMNPAEVAPDTNKVLKGLAREDLFTVVHEQFMTDTARYADIVLPATMFVEHEDIYKGGGHMYLQVARKVIEPYAECRSNHDVNCALGQRLGSDHPGFHMTAWEMIDRTLKDTGMPGADEVADGRWLDCSKPYEEANYLNGFNHPDGKFRFSPDWKALGDHQGIMPSLPDHQEIIDAATEAHPFRMVTAPARRYLNSSFTEMPSSIAKEGRPRVLVHPDVCVEMGLVEGDRIRLGNNQGSVVVHVRPFDGLQRDVVVVEGIWPNHAFEEGIGINALTSADRGAPAGGAVFHDTAVWMKAA
ncbi:MAG: molybdopterin oxidoreductase family protein [Rhodospirillales bacterium]|nr:molybdopterin oxidoreductase family protein [Rhodospirillales bacterium]